MTQIDPHAARRLLAATLLQAAIDLQAGSRHERLQALYWLRCRETREIAMLIDLALPEPARLTDMMEARP